MKSNLKLSSRLILHIILLSNEYGVFSFVVPPLQFMNNRQIQALYLRKQYHDHGIHQNDSNSYYRTEYNDKVSYRSSNSREFLLHAKRKNRSSGNTTAQSDTINKDNTKVEETIQLTDKQHDNQQVNDETIYIPVPDFKKLMKLQLAPSSEIAYFYLKNKIGLSEETMWKITNDAGTVLGFTVLNLEKKISLLSRTMNLSQEDLQIILSKQPTILHLSPTRNLSPTILFLVRALDLSKAELRSMIVKYPCILCYSMNNLKQKIKFFSTIMGYTTTDMRHLLVDEPKLLCAAVSTGLVPRMNFLRKEMKIDIEDLRIIILKNPRLLLYSLQNLQSKLISFFVMRLHMDEDHILKLLKSWPSIMDYNLEEHMIPIIRLFQAELDFSALEMRSIVLKFPRLMSYSLFKIKHVVGYFRYELGMDARQVKRVLFQAPQVISLSTDITVASKVEFLQKSFGLKVNDSYYDENKSEQDDALDLIEMNTIRPSNDDIRTVIAGMPTLLLCSIENNLRPKAEYLFDVFDGDILELRQAVLTLPTLLGYSLDKRIRPRMECILNNGLRPIKITIGITMKDQKFDDWVENASLKLSQSTMNNNNNMSTFPQNFDSQKSSSMNDRIDDSLSIVLRNPNQDNNRNGRIVHWTRNDM